MAETTKIKNQNKDSPRNRSAKKPVDSRTAKAKVPAKKSAKKVATKRATPSKMGRPSIYSEALADTICERIASGESMRKICLAPDMPERMTVLRWLAKNETFAAKYARAREIQAHVWVDEIYDVASMQPERAINGSLDSASVTHIRNRVATMQWLAMKLNPKKYGDKVDVNHGGQAENPFSVLLQQVDGTSLPIKGDE